jgi:hypothetical protein
MFITRKDRKPGMNEIPEGPFCQSCGMPMSEPVHFGTEKDGSKSEEYCSYCYQNGAFIDESITLEEMIEFSAQKIDEAGIMPYSEARKMTGEFLPELKRWKK